MKQPRVDSQQQFELSKRGPVRPARLPWCETQEDYEAVMADLAAQESRWS